MKQAMCKCNYDPYYGFSVIGVGRIVWVQDLKNELFGLYSATGNLLGTISKSSFFEYFN